MRRVSVTRRAPVTQRSKHRAISPCDICLTPSPIGPVPIPYINIAPSSHLRGGSGHVRCEGASVMIAGARLTPSTGNEAGTGGGIFSHTTRGAARALSHSVVVRIEGKGVVRTHDLTLQNSGNCVGKIC